MKKFISLVLAFMLIVGFFSVSVSAQGDIMVMGQMRSKKLYRASATNHKQTAKNALSKYVDLDEFTVRVLSGISDCKSNIDVSKYNIPTSLLDAITDYFFYGVPEAFNIEQMGCTFYTNKNNIVDITVFYNSFADTASEYDECYSKMVYGAEYILQDIKGNANLNDEQKLLLLHDRLAIWNMYDYDRLETNDPIIYTAYGALGEGASVCQGYAMAYMYLLRQVGIESYYCSSEDLCHGWNIVFLNGKKYHVDVTWDDFDTYGEVKHDNFLRSSNGIYATGHDKYDYDTTPTDTKYDSYYWQDSNAEFQLLNNEIFYIDHNDKKLKRYSDKKALCSVDGSYSTLANDGRSLIYSSNDKIYRFDLSTNKSETIYTVQLGSDEILCGMEYWLDEIHCMIYDFETSAYRVISQPYKYDYNDDDTGNEDDEMNVPGDSNSDGSIDNKDYALLMQYLNGWAVTIVAESSDVNADGSIDNKDYALLMQYLNDWDVVLR
ncbi:MAG: hypothetical protein E7521_02300 [Ruminococcaceae bacterium]|nr:hypothetical protein [Oscillospiraceae bacterium]